MRTKNKSKENKSKIRNILKIVFLLIIVGVAIVFLKKDKNNNINLRFDMLLPGKKQIFSETSHKFLKSALIDLADQLEKQIKKYRSL